MTFALKVVARYHGIIFGYRVKDLRMKPTSINYLENNLGHITTF
jgi:hypothetical protein